jgi:hypothetical protein
MLFFAIQMCVQHKFYDVQEKKIEQTFAASLLPFGISFCHLMA